MTRRGTLAWTIAAGAFFAASHLGLALVPLLLESAPWVLAVLRPSNDSLLLLKPSLGWVPVLLIAPLRWLLHVTYFELGRSGGPLVAALASPRFRSLANVTRLRRFSRLAVIVVVVWPNTVFDVLLGAVWRSRRSAYLALACGVIFSTALTTLIGSTAEDALGVVVATIAGDPVALIACCAASAISVIVTMWRVTRRLRARREDSPMTPPEDGRLPGGAVEK